MAEVDRAHSRHPRIPWRLIAAAVIAMTAGCAITTDPDDTAVAVSDSNIVLDSDALPRNCGRLPPCCPQYTLIDGVCVLHPPPPPPPDGDETLRPRYYVLSLLYIPPGNASSVSYENTSGVSQRIDLSGTLKVSASVKAGPVTAGFEATDVTGRSYQLTSTSSNQLSVDRHGTDLIPADADTFVLLFGAGIRVTRVNGVTTVFTPDLTAAEPVRVTTAQLKNPALMDPFTASHFTHFTATDYQRILALNPRAASGGEVGDPARYTFLQNMALTGPLPPSYDTVISERQTYDRTVSNDNLHGTSVSESISLEVADELNIFKLTTEIAFTYESTVTNSTDATRSATVTLSSTTNDCAASYAVYFDSLFNTLAFKSLGASPACH
jgi:hypothetical protein